MTRLLYSLLALCNVLPVTCNLLAATCPEVLEREFSSNSSWFRHTRDRIRPLAGDVAANRRSVCCGTNAVADQTCFSFHLRSGSRSGDHGAGITTEQVLRPGRECLCCLRPHGHHRGQWPAHADYPHPLPAHSTRPPGKKQRRHASAQV